MSQFAVPCVVYRGGTSRGLFFHEKDLPQDIETRNNVFLCGVDAYNVSQIDGLGSGTSHTSKVVVIAPSSLEGVDIDYTFIQVGIGKEVLDNRGTCGNLMAAVGPFAVDEGLVQVDPSAELVTVSVFNTNIGKRIQIQVPVINGKAKVSGNYRMSGIAKPGAQIMVDLLSPGGGKTGKTLPLGSQYAVTANGSMYDVSFVDVVNPFVFVACESLGISGTEPNSEISMNSNLMETLDSIRNQMTVAVGMAQTVAEAKAASPAVPKIAIVAEPQDYVTTSGKFIKKEEVDIVAKMVSMGLLHRTFAGSGLYNIAAATLLPGTIPNQLSSIKQGTREQLIRIGHPDGIVHVRVSLTEDGQDIAAVGLDRTARRIIKGDLFIPGGR